MTFCNDNDNDMHGMDVIIGTNSLASTMGATIRLGQPMLS